MSLKSRIQEDMKAAMKTKQAERLSAIRLLLAAMKQKEVDERIELSDGEIVAIIDKMLKQRRESISQYEAAQRQDLADKERFEVTVLQDYMPQPLSESDIEQAIAAAIATTGASAVSDMGKVMNLLRPQLTGRADMAQVSARIKARLAG